MFDLYGVMAGLYVPASASCSPTACACNQGLRTNSVATINSSTSTLVDVPSTQLSWSAACELSAGILRRPVLIAQLSAPSSPDPIVVYQSTQIQQGVIRMALGIPYITDFTGSIHVLLFDHKDDPDTLTQQLAAIGSNPLIVAIVAPLMGSSTMWTVFLDNSPTGIPVFAPSTSLMATRTPFRTELINIRPSNSHQINGLVDWLVDVQNVSRISILLQARDASGSLAADAQNFADAIDDATARRQLNTYSRGVFVQGSGDINAALDSIFVSAYIPGSQAYNPITVTGPDAIILGVDDAGMDEASLFVRAVAGRAGLPMVYGVPYSASWSVSRWSETVNATSGAVFGMLDTLLSDVGSMLELHAGAWVAYEVDSPDLHSGLGFEEFWGGESQNGAGGLPLALVQSR
ncbi:hypothetical protein BDK51DRAFT_28616 [Blyttiomyces helicus]|uniref:Periplasmic binding protein-like I n=1 Tax=Blyttiomyces helicus TaxID=388810 RepID=A0A4V1ISA0_9FUNG|nr:hypothetical protein BDK51DRAFT_28616 [Blyttiomyces helicus]|eukprot:RKO92827.1 hypothetical protein BDK51DRAFT_28616 [Blyttiomyces helicus]